MEIKEFSNASLDKEFSSFISLMKEQIFDILKKRINITDISLINEDYSFTNFVYKIKQGNNISHVVKLNIGDRSIWYNFKHYLEDKKHYILKIAKEEYSQLIENQYQDYKTLFDFQIPSIKVDEIQKIKNMLIMPFLEGKDLTSFLFKEKRIEVDLVENLSGLLQKLEVLHKRKKVFGDLKMDNIFISSDGPILIDPQIKEGEEKDDYGKLIFNGHLLTLYTNKSLYYEIVEDIFSNRLLFNSEKIKEYKEHGYRIYSHLLTLNYPFNSKEYQMMKSLYGIRK